MSSWNGDERHSLGRGSMSQNVSTQGRETPWDPEMGKRWVVAYPLIEPSASPLYQVIGDRDWKSDRKKTQHQKYRYIIPKTKGLKK